MGQIFLYIIAVVILGACSAGVDSIDEKASLKLYLTDAPNDNLTSVFVNIKHYEIWLEGQGKKARLIVGEGTGLVDLLQLSNGIMMPVAGLDLPSGVNVNKFRLILKGDGHFAIKNDGTNCELRTPSAQRTGLKINLPEAISMSPGQNVSVVLDFDAKHSVVQLGNGDCLLKPVLKIKTAIVHEPDDGLNYAIGDLPPGDDIFDEEPSNQDDPNYDGSGFDPTDPSTWPEGITEEDLVRYF